MNNRSQDYKYQNPSVCSFRVQIKAGLTNLAAVKGHVTVKIAVFWGRFYTALIRCEFSGEEYHSIIK